MTPQLSPKEKSLMTAMAANKHTPVQIQARMAVRRAGLAKKSRAKKPTKSLGHGILPRVTCTITAWVRNHVFSC